MEGGHHGMYQPMPTLSKRASKVEQKTNKKDIHNIFFGGE
jgi:hypothetical protein